MKKSFLRLGFFALFISFIAAGCATTNNPSPAKEKVSAIVSAGFPEGYQDWANTCSKTVLDKTSPFYGFQRVLVDAEALPAYKNGGQYRDGSRLVLEFNEPLREGPKGEDIAKGNTNWIAVMTKDSGGSTAKTTGGWNFEAYDGASKLKKDMDVVAGCFNNCHKAMEHKNYVFSSK